MNKQKFEISCNQFEFINEQKTHSEIVGRVWWKKAITMNMWLILNDAFFRGLHECDDDWRKFDSMEIDSSRISIEKSNFHGVDAENRLHNAPLTFQFIYPFSISLCSRCVQFQIRKPHIFNSFSLYSHHHPHQIHYRPQKSPKRRVNEWLVR